VVVVRYGFSIALPFIFKFKANSDDADSFIRVHFFL